MGEVEYVKDMGRQESGKPKNEEHAVAVLKEQEQVSQPGEEQRDQEEPGKTAGRSYRGPVEPHDERDQDWLGKNAQAGMVLAKENIS